jgi:hypothetical protein
LRSAVAFQHERRALPHGVSGRSLPARVDLQVWQDKGFGSRPVEKPVQLVCVAMLSPGTPRRPHRMGLQPMSDENLDSLFGPH